MATRLLDLPRLRRTMGRALAGLGRALGPFLGLVVVASIFAVLTRDYGFRSSWPFVAAAEDPAGGVWLWESFSLRPPFIHGSRTIPGDPHRQRFLTADNLKTIATQTAIVGTCGIGMTIVIIGGSIDLSVGSAVALVVVAIALGFNGFSPDWLATLRDQYFAGQGPLVWLAALVVTLVAALALKRRQPWWKIAVGVVVSWGLVAAIVLGERGAAAVLGGVAVGIACGLLNGTLITRLGLVPFIVTLGTMEIFRGAAQFLAKGESVGVDRDLLRQSDWLYRLMIIPETPAWVATLPPQWAPVVEATILAPAVYVMIVAGLMAAVILGRTRLGRYILAIGSNEQAARLSGVPVTTVKLWMYGLAGLMTGLAAVMQFARLSYGSSTAAMGLELDVIAAVVIGGGSLRGGEGSVMGTFIGAFIMSIMRNGCVLAGIPTAVQRMLIGGIILLAVGVDELRHRRRR